MALTPTFAVGPPPSPGSMTRTGGRDVFVPNPQFYNWQRLFWQWSETLGNNADGAATFSGSIAIGTSPNWFKADSSGIWLGGASFAASPFKVSMAGALTATSGSFSGFSIGTDYVRDVANSFGLASTVTGGNDVRFWAGDTFANRDTAAVRIYENGDSFFSAMTVAKPITVTQITGQAPFTITSTTRVSNLNVATAGTADQLTTARTIGGSSFNGTANITVDAATLQGNAASAFASASHTHSFWQMTSSSSYRKAQYSVDEINWNNIFLRSYDW